MARQATYLFADLVRPSDRRRVLSNISVPESEGARYPIPKNETFRHRFVDKWEGEEWKFVEIRLLFLRQRFASTVEIYTQAIAWEEAQAPSVVSLAMIAAAIVLL